MQDTTIYMVQGDSAPARLFSFQRTDGTIPDLTSATSVDFYIFRPDTGVQTNSGATTCVIQTPRTLGQAQYTWRSTDLPVNGVFRCLLSIVYSDGTKETAIVYVDTETNAT